MIQQFYCYMFIFYRIVCVYKETHIRMFTDNALLYNTKEKKQ